MTLLPPALVEADRHIRHAQANVRRQQMIIDELSQRGEATFEAVSALQSMLAIVEEMQWHRHRIAVEHSGR
jgi:hypothetical protein